MTKNKIKNKPRGSIGYTGPNRKPGAYAPIRVHKAPARGKEYGIGLPMSITKSEFDSIYKAIHGHTKSDSYKTNPADLEPDEPDVCFDYYYFARQEGLESIKDWVCSPMCTSIGCSISCSIVTLINYWAGIGFTAGFVSADWMCKVWDCEGLETIMNWVRPSNDVKYKFMAGIVAGILYKNVWFMGGFVGGLLAGCFFGNWEKSVAFVEIHLDSIKGGYSELKRRVIEFPNFIANDPWFIGWAMMTVASLVLFPEYKKISAFLIYFVYIFICWRFGRLAYIM